MDKKKKMPAFGPILRQFRVNAGLSQEELGARLGYNSSGYVSRLELGEKKPSVELLFLIAEALAVEPSELIKAMQESR